MDADLPDFVPLRADVHGFDPTLKKTLKRDLFFGVKRSKSKLRLSYQS